MYVYLITWQLRPETEQGDELIATIAAQNEEQARILVHAAIAGGPKTYKSYLDAHAVNVYDFTVRQIKFPSMMLKPM